MTASTTVFEPPALGRVHPLGALRRLRQFDDLFFTLSRHRVKVRYKQSRLGLLWAVIQPLAMMLVFTLMFTFLRTAPSGQVPYALFAYSALIPWTMFSSALTNACTALTSHAALLTKVYFPREILPLTYIVAALVDMAAASVVLAALMMWFGVSLTSTAIWALPAIAILTGLLVGLGLLAVGAASAVSRRRAGDAGAGAGLAIRKPGPLPALRREGRACCTPVHALHSQSDGRHSGHVSPRGGAASAARSARARDVRARRRRCRAGSLRLLQVRRADDGGRRMSEATVDVAIENVWKQYRLSTSRNARTFWALQDVSLNVLRGASVGVIGRNGAGKSTLLKLLAGITAPTRGRIVIHGRVAALIELGSGFHPELTGRENVFLSGAILGMRRREIAAKLERIVEFAGVRQFIDTPVKWYSSGHVRATRLCGGRAHASPTSCWSTKCSPLATRSSR